MDALAAARLGDEVAHGFGLMAMVGGAVLGAVVGAVVVAATVATGGAALAIVAGSVAAGGLGLGQLVKGICTAASLPEPTTGKLVMGSSNIRINSRAAMRASVDMAGVCSGIPLNHYPWPAPLIAEGSATVRFNGKPAARLSSKMVCGAHIKSGSGNVRIGGPTVRTNFVWDVEQWTEWALIGLGLGALGVAGRAAWVAGKWLGVGKFGAMLGLGFGGFELLGQIGDRLGPGYRDILQGAAGVVLLGLTPKLVKGHKPAAEGAAAKAQLTSSTNQAGTQSGRKFLDSSTSTGAPVHHGKHSTAIGADDATMINFRQATDTGRGHNVIVHGSRPDYDLQGGVFVVEGNPTHSQQIAEALLSNPNYQRGSPVCLGSCWSGSNGTAQEVANAIGAPVTAPTRPVRFDQISGQWEQMSDLMMMRRHPDMIHIALEMKIFYPEIY